MPYRLLDELIERYRDLSACKADILAAFETLQEGFANGGKLLVCGNGGSAADADHLSGELLKGFRSRRPLPPAQRQGLPPSLADRLQQALPVIPLGGFPAFSSAFANDVDPHLAYAQLVWALGRPGDVFWGITTSGQSPNVCLAAETARVKGLRNIGLTGRDGERLESSCEVCIKVPAQETFKIQEYHVPVYHALCLMLEVHFFP